jgi:predicted O-methyltransferase YrrM
MPRRTSDHGDPRETIDRLYAQGSVTARSDGTAHDLFPIAIAREEGEALWRWVIRERAEHTLEVGLGYAVASLFVCDGLLATGNALPRHVAIDPYQQEWFAGCGLQLLDDAGVSAMVEFHAAESQLVLPRFAAEGRVIDLAFVDGSHWFDGVFLDLVYLQRIVRPGGVVFVDDLQLPAVARAVAYCVANFEWVSEES